MRPTDAIRQALRRTSPRRVGVAACVLIFYLVLLSGIAPPSLEAHPWLRTARNIFQSLTGAGGSFGFFSPNVGNQALIDFYINDNTNPVRLHELVTPEVALRVQNMYRLFVETYEKEPLKRSIAASLTAQVFRRFPEARRVTMVVSVFKFPSLVEYSRGLNPETREAYRVTFAVGEEP